MIYVFVTELNNPCNVIAEPFGYLIAPFGKERVGDVSNVVFTNGAVARENGDVYIYYTSKCKIFVGKRKEKIKKRVQKTCTLSRNML